MQEKNKKRLLLDVDEKLHTEIKTRASFRNMSIKKWIMQAIAERIKWEDKYK